MLGRDGTIQAVEGGPPMGLLSRRVDECASLPEGVKRAARRLVRDLTQPRAHTLLRRVTVQPEGPDDPSYTLLAVEAIPIRPAEVALDPLVREVLAPLMRQAEEVGVSLRVEAGAELPTEISIDAAKIVWAVTTLVGNALRYVRHGGPARRGGYVRVSLGASPAKDMVSITVEDDGPGIPTNVQARLLASDPCEATGVSLRLINDVVAAHGGGMVIKSSTAPEDRGTAVTLWLPVRG